LGIAAKNGALVNLVARAQDRSTFDGHVAIEDTSRPKGRSAFYIAKRPDLNIRGNLRPRFNDG
jgi:hypothetical protein